MKREALVGGVKVKFRGTRVGEGERVKGERVKGEGRAIVLQVRPGQMRG